MAKKETLETLADLINACMYVVSNGGKKLEIEHRYVFASNANYHDYTVFYGRHRLFSLLKSDTGDEIFLDVFNTDVNYPIKTTNYAYTATKELYRLCQEQYKMQEERKKAAEKQKQQKQDQRILNKLVRFVRRYQGGFILPKKEETLADLIDACTRVVNNGGKRLEIEVYDYENHKHYYEYKVSYGQHQLFWLREDQEDPQVLSGRRMIVLGMESSVTNSEIEYSIKTTIPEYAAAKDLRKLCGEKYNEQVVRKEKERQQLDQKILNKLVRSFRRKYQR